MSGNHKYDTIVLTVNKWLIRFLMGLLTICLVLASLDLVRILYIAITKPPFLLLDITTLFSIFNLLLIVAVGYELVKSFHTIISSNIIPTVPIIQIAVIAVANKIITLDLKNTNAPMIFGLAGIMASLGLSYFFLKNRKETLSAKEEEPES